MIVKLNLPTGYNNVNQTRIEYANSTNVHSIKNTVCYGGHLADLRAASYNNKDVIGATLTQYINLSNIHEIDEYFVNNACFLEIEDIKYFLDYINKYIMPIEYMLKAKLHHNTLKALHKVCHTEETSSVNFITLVIKEKITDARAYSLFRLSLVRYLFEFPYNVALYDAIKIKKAGLAKNLNLFELAHMFSAVSSPTKFFNDGQYFIHDKKPRIINLLKMKKTLKDITWINTFFSESTTPIDIDTPFITNEFTSVITPGKAELLTFDKYSLYFDYKKRSLLTGKKIAYLEFKPNWKERYNIMYKNMIKDLSNSKKKKK